MQSRWRLLILSALILAACSPSVKQLPPRPQKIDHAQEVPTQPTAS